MQNVRRHVGGLIVGATVAAGAVFAWQETASADAPDAGPLHGMQRMAELDRRVQPQTSCGAEEGGVTEGEDAAVGRLDPVAASGSRGLESDGRRVEAHGLGRPVEGRVAVGRHPTVC